MLRLLMEPIVRAALLEDLGRAGDITSEAIVPAETPIEAVIAARQAGVVAGLETGLLALEPARSGTQWRASVRRGEPGRAGPAGRAHQGPGAAGAGGRADRA